MPFNISQFLYNPFNHAAVAAHHAKREAEQFRLNLQRAEESKAVQPSRDTFAAKVLPSQRSIIDRRIDDMSQGTYPVRLFFSLVCYGMMNQECIQYALSHPRAYAMGRDILLK
jgi:hypothetical protein